MSFVLLWICKLPSYLTLKTNGIVCWFEIYSYARQYGVHREQALFPIAERQGRNQSPRHF